MKQPSPLLVSLWQWTIVLLMPILLTLTSLYVFMSPAFIAWQYARPDFPPAQRFTPEARLANSIATLRYVRGDLSLQDLKNLGVYNDREIKHLVDVQNVTRAMFILHPLALVLILVAGFMLIRNPLTRRQAARGILYGGLLTLALVGGIGLFSVLAFDAFFVAFHRLFFEGDTWLFNYSDSLIQFYPEPFWMTAAYGIALFVLTAGGLVTGLGWYVSRLLAR